MANTQIVSKMASQLIGSEILKIAAEINALKASGKRIYNFTVGDFDPQYFPVPKLLSDEIKNSLDRQETNYPPSSGIMELRESVAQFYTREFKVPTKASEVLIAGGARPLIYTIFTALVDPGDTVIYPVPSWNNNHYCHLSGAKGIAVTCRAENAFLPVQRDFEPYIKSARLICLNTPLNPAGTNFSKAALLEICEAVVSENKRRVVANEKPLYVMFDHIYWKIAHGATEHHYPLALCPEIKPFMIFVDGLSKYFCATGLRVGWSLVPENLMPSFSSLLGHIGAWAPKPEQMATAKLLNASSAVEDFVRSTKEKLAKRLFGVFEGIQQLKAQGLPVDVIRPQGGIYLSLRILPRQNLDTNEKIRKALLEKVGIAVVPFQAFGLQEDSGWFRLSMGAISEADSLEAVNKLKEFLLTLS